MSIESINTSSRTASDSVMGWEDIAIVIKDTRYSTAHDANHIVTDTNHTMESSYQQQQEQEHGGEDMNDYHHPMIHDFTTIPSSMPVGSSDDSCSSDSTESSLNSGHSSSRSSNVYKDRSEEEDPNPSLESQPPHISHEPNDGIKDTSSDFGSEQRIRSGVQPLRCKSKVHFSTVQVRDYDVTLGDHPYCDMYPLSLDWNYTAVLTTTMDDFEENHRRRIPSETRVFSPVVARKVLKKGKGGVNNMVQVRARKLSVMERMSLLIEFTGVTSQQLYQLERKRQLLAQDEKLLCGINASLAFV